MNESPSFDPDLDYLVLETKDPEISFICQVLRGSRISIESLVSWWTMLFSVAYNLELYNAISIYYTSHILPTNVKLVVSTL